MNKHLTLQYIRNRNWKVISTFSAIVDEYVLFNSMNIDSLWKTSHAKVLNDKTLNDYTSNERKTSFILSNDRTTNAIRTSNRRTKLRRIVQKVEIKYVESFKTPNRTNCQSITIK
jgi:hypothetical protein